MTAAALCARPPGGLLICTVTACLLLGACGDSVESSPATPANAQAAGGAQVNPARWPAINAALPRDADLEARIDGLLAAMSLEDKVGQIIQADIGSVTPDDVRRYRLGAILSGGNSAPEGNLRASPQQWLALADAFHAASIEAPDRVQAIPVMWGIDAVHGHSHVIGATIFPHNIGLGAARDPELVREIGRVTAREIAVTGLDWTFAPTLAVARDDRWGRTYEAYSEDPELVRAYAKAMIEGLQGAAGSGEFLGADRVIATAKHFVGDGGAHDGRDQGDNRGSEAELRDVHAAGYTTAIAAGVQTIMVSYSAWHGQKLHGHRPLLTDVLKGRMAFDGFLVGDWNGHGQVAGCSNVSCAPAITAGLDMFMAPDSWRDLYANTLAQSRAGAISIDRLDDAVRRVLRVKLRAGLFDKGRPSSRRYAGRFELLGAEAHRALARRAVRESLVLLKNQGGLLPLRPDRRLLVAGDGADNIPKQCGGWTLTWQGTDLGNEDFPNAQSIFTGIAAAVGAAGGSAELAPSGEFHTRPDAAIVVFGEDPYAEFQGDLVTLEYSPGDKKDLALLRRLKAQGIPVVAVFLTGRPLWVNPEINAADAFVVAWLPGGEGRGIADVLLRKPDGTVAHDFKAKLSFSWPALPLQVNVNRGDGDTPQFPYGFGMTYADSVDLPRLAEEPPRRPTSLVDPRTFYAAGQPGSGWRFFAQEAGSVRVDLTGAAAKGLPSGSLTVAPAHRRGRSDARSAAWSGTVAASLGIDGSKAIDLRREANGQLSLAFELRVTRPPAAPVIVAMRCGPRCEGSMQITDALRTRGDEWRMLKIPLSCFERAGARMQEISAPFVLTTAGELGIELSAVRLETGLAGLTHCDR